MVADPIFFEHALTGRVRHRVSLFGKVILQVEERIDRVSGCGPFVKRYFGDLRWRDATFDDYYNFRRKVDTD